MYLIIKNTHLTLVTISLLLFSIRGLMMVLKNENYRHRIFRVLPPLVDTLLLASGVSLMVILQQYPTTVSWLAVKLSALIIYILLGVVALNRVNNYRLQVISFIAAVSVVLFMVSVAINHHPLGIFYGLMN